MSGNDWPWGQAKILVIPIEVFIKDANFFKLGCMNTGFGQGSCSSIRTTASMFKAVPRGSRSIVWLWSEQVGDSADKGKS